MKIKAEEKILEILKDNKFHKSTELSYRANVVEYRKPIHLLKKRGYTIFQGTLKYPSYKGRVFGYILLPFNQISTFRGGLCPKN